ncbi:UNVERIFIED_CONTAM: hypothetical protein Sradi_2878300 [Sesamum radiatum]|uniref:UspA domain-containing protein n=1 Tax=Sesamum radiatum TaxID=300843 RepID=A0AAW2RYC0_SESRA
MSKGGEVQKVMVILTCIDVNWSGLKWLPDALSLYPGDELILLGLLHLVTPRALSLWAAAKLLGYKNKEDANKVLESTRKFREEEVRRRKEEFSKSSGLMQLQKLCEIEQVKVSMDVEAGSSRKVAAVRAAKRLGATWIILGREMKKDKQYFMDRLSCRISSIKSNNTVIELRGPINEHVSYDEMIPSYSWEDLSPPSKSFNFLHEIPTVEVLLVDPLPHRLHQLSPLCSCIVVELDAPVLILSNEAFQNLVVD